MNAQAPRQRLALRHTRRGQGEPAGAVSVRLKEPCGNDELALDGVNTEAAIALLARLVEAPDGGALARRMPAADRDALLAVLHRRCWGDRIVSTLRCAHCAAQFDLSFTLSAVQRQLYDDAQRCIAQQGGDAPLPPSGEQELAAAELLFAGAAAEALRQLAGDRADPPALASLLEQCAPIIDLELDAHCAECGHAQQAHFDLQRFVLQRLLNERALLLHEVHALASAYHWSLHEILALPRTQRRQFAELLSGGMQ